MRKLSLSSLSAVVVDDRVFTLVRDERRLTLLSLDTSSGVIDELASFQGSRGFVLKAGGGRILVSINDKLYLIEDGACRLMLTATRPENVFWHLVENNGVVFMHEYGESPTGIYVSEDLEHWRKLITNFDIDKSSRHFHYLAYDRCRNWLIATLGDGCLVRVITSPDLGNSWRPLYRGPWQFVPIVPLEDRIVLGMDSGIARGGVGVYFPEGLWNFIFLKWVDGTVRFAQMSDLKLLSNGLWLVALGTPQAILASEDLKTWKLVYVESFDKAFNIHMMISEGTDKVVCSTGKSLLLLSKSELENSLKTQPVMVEYKAHLDKLRGAAFVLKRRLSSL